MEVSVRRIYARNEQNEIALCFLGRKWANCVVVDYPIRVYTMDKREMKGLEAPLYQGKPYPVRRLAESLSRLAKKNGMTIAAQRLVDACLAGEHLSEELIDAKPSENGADPSPKVRKTEGRKRQLAETSEELAPGATPPQATAGNLVATLSEKYGLDPRAARRKLRAAGLSAPYTDAAKVEAALKGKK